MTSIAIGDVLSDGELAWLDESDQLHMIPVHWLAAGKKVVLSEVPGAFTPICKSVSNVVNAASEVVNVTLHAIHFQLHQHILTKRFELAFFCTCDM
ncbi:hypothetical protein ZIOFF_043860 [Zingiber officinale]|uniref:Uncharacterized protein n=1 Tax=Zingiber officinale TaxID=94328 RepID=A0A8J5G030_ZINOF|nr:hypothetical protein ZIOFF_043860 [Zingiber officinale]